MRCITKDQQYLDRIKFYFSFSIPSLMNFVTEKVSRNIGSSHSGVAYCYFLGMRLM